MVQIHENNELLPVKIETRKNCWLVHFTPKKAGILHCNVFVYFSHEEKEKNFHISGSPFYLQIQEKGKENKLFFQFESTHSFELGSLQTIDLPFYLSFLDFMRSIPLSSTNTIIQDDKKIEEQKKLLTLRLEKLGIKVELENVSNADSASLVRAFAQQYFGSAIKFHFVRKCVVGWLRNHSDFKLSDDISIEERIGGGSFDEYCDHLESSVSWLDSLALVALSEFFGVRIIIISAVEGDDFITDYAPAYLRSPNPIVLGNWSQYFYVSFPVSSPLSFLCF